MTEKEIEQKLRDDFENNYEYLSLESGHGLNPFVREEAFQQVLYYFKKLKQIASKVTETEVRLTLPEQTTKKGRKFTIEGIVDIVVEDDEVCMYDIKTHDKEHIEKNKDFYKEQLGVYAYIWQGLRGEKLDRLAVISTSLPGLLKLAIRNGNKEKELQEFAKWDPVIPLEIIEDDINLTVEKFGIIVDKIEENEFAPVSLEKLNEIVASPNVKFATRVCRNCDARFSCASHRKYVMESNEKSKDQFKKYLNDYGDDGDHEDFLLGNIPEGER
jgi:hypothetical protein